MLGGFLWVTTAEELAQCHAVRRNVFMEEQGFEVDIDTVDDHALHLLFLDDEEPIGTLRLFIEDGDWHIGRICVKKAYRDKGIGRFLVQEALQKAKEQGQSTRAVLGSQIQVQGFYEKLGFVAYGEQYLDEGWPHIHMACDLTTL